MSYQLALAKAAALVVSTIAVPTDARKPAARVEANAVVNPAEGIAVTVPESAVFVGSDRFTLYDVADAEVHVFAEADAHKRLSKLYWIQFESYLPAKPELFYDYAEGNTRVDLSGVPTWVRAGPSSTRGPLRAGSDRAHVQAILEKARYTIPPEVLNVRMVQVLGDPHGTGKGRKELMIIYSEDLAPSGTSVAGLGKAGPTSSQWHALERALIERAKKAITIQYR